MTAQPVRQFGSNSREPVSCDLNPIRFEGMLVGVRLTLRQAEDGVWRGKLQFTEEGVSERETVEIFCGASEQDLWQSVRDLRDHHLRDLYRSLV